MRPVLILRPEPGATVTALRAREMGLTAIIRPLFEARSVAWTAPDPARFDAVMMTSANAARLGGNRLADYLHLRLYAVGEATADAARAAGFTDVIAGAADVGALAGDIASAGHHDVLFLAGHDRVPLMIAAFDLETVTVYASNVLSPPEIPNDTVALLHSARAARRFAEIATDKSSTAIVAISSAVAEAAGAGWRAIAVAPRPQDTAMLALAASLCETPSE
ncbi:MAG: uroporphyrinogen synthase [Sphingomonadales bacterium]|nr:uroporphyrinogen synthase [Sphingomonadales bacterium]